MSGGSCLAGSVEADNAFGRAVYDTILLEKSLAVAETNFVNMSREHSNEPPYLGKLEAAMASRYSYEQQKQRDRIFEHCEAALRYPLVYSDACRVWELIGVTREWMQYEVPARELPALRREVLAAYLNGLKAAAGDIRFAGMFKGCVARFYANNPYYQEILTEGIKTFPDEAVLQEILETVEKSNHLPLPPALENQPAIGSMSFNAKQYEVEGVIEEDLLGNFPGNIRAEFHVWVKDGSWLVETWERERSRGPLRSQRTGTTNATEIFELDVPVDRKIEAWPANTPASLVRALNGGGPGPEVGTPITQGIASMGFIASNALPVTRDDEGLVPHLWLMFASQGYFHGLSTNRLTPAYRFDATGTSLAIPKLEAEWTLMGGSAALPLRVNYYTDGGAFEGFLQAAYRVTGITNFGGTVFPGGFLFEQFAPTGSASRYDLKTVRRARVTVTAFRPVCTRKNLLPEAEGTVLVHDMRLPGAELHGHGYVQKGGARWFPVADSKEVSEGRSLHRKQSPVFLVVFGVLLLLPPVVIIIKSMKRKSPGLPPA
jgi:hypothetical protein